MREAQASDGGNAFDHHDRHVDSYMLVYACSVYIASTVEARLSTVSLDPPK
jgi:hypothetical protein